MNFELVKQIVYNKSWVIILIISILLLTFLRAFVIPLYIVFPLFLFMVIPYRIPAKVWLLFFFSIFIVILFYLQNKNLLGNYLLSLYVVFVSLFTFFSSPLRDFSAERGKAIFAFFIRTVTFVMLVNNFLGLVQYIIHPVYPLTLMRDDSFIGLYGTHGIGSHGMSLINGLLFLYYFFRYNQTKSKNTLTLLLVFLISFVMGFYGMGLMVMIISLVIYYFFIRRNVVLTVAACFAIIFVGAAVYLVAPKTFLYTVENVEKFTSAAEDIEKKGMANKDNIPRKVFIYYYYYKNYVRNNNRFLFGTGPGTFNSRISFLLNGDYSSGNPFEKVFGVQKPHYASRYAYPLWKKQVVQNVNKFHDGTRNQPFSSVISLLAEYGAVFFIVLVIFSWTKGKKVLARLKQLALKGCWEAKVLKEFLLISFVFVGINLFVDNLLEFTEMMFFIVFFKFIEAYSIYLENDNAHAHTAST